MSPQFSQIDKVDNVCLCMDKYIIPKLKLKKQNLWILSLLHQAQFGCTILLDPIMDCCTWTLLFRHLLFYKMCMVWKQ